MQNLPRLRGPIDRGTRGQSKCSHQCREYGGEISEILSVGKNRDGTLPTAELYVHFDVGGTFRIDEQSVGKTFEMRAFFGEGWSSTAELWSFNGLIVCIAQKGV